MDLDRTLVDLLRRYSNRSDLRDDLDRVAAKFQQPPDPDLMPEPPRERPSESLRVTARLSPDDIALLIARYQAGEIARTLAEEFGISRSSVKRLLRKHKARRKDQGSNPA